MAAALAVLCSAMAPAVHAADCPNASLREGASAHLPGCRAYEVVTPPPLGGVPVLNRYAKVRANDDGSAVHFSAIQPMTFPGQSRPPLGQNPPKYVSERSPGGWRLSAPGVGDFGGLSRNMNRALIWTITPLHADDADGTTDVYLRDRDGSVIWLSRDPRIPAGTPQTGVTADMAALAQGVEGTMSANGDTVAFTTQGALVDEDPVADGTRRLYKWSRGELRFIGALPDGSTPGASGGPQNKGAFGIGWDQGVGDGMVSRDGRRVIFSADREGASDGDTDPSLYVQTDGAATVEASREFGVPPLTDEEFLPVTFRGASSDGSRVFFTTASRLTPDSGAGATFGGAEDLYVYDVDTDRVIDVTPRLDGVDDPEVDPAFEDSARVRGVAAVSEDGRRVYFVADAAYDTAESTQGASPVEGSPNLYLAEIADSGDQDVDLTFVATLGPGEEGVWRSAEYGFGTPGRRANATADGSVLAFGSAEELTDQPLNGTTQLFVFDVGRGTLECASCPEAGLPSGEVNAEFTNGASTYDGWGTGLVTKRFISETGAVFFDTSTPLVGADRNTTQDVYEYSLASGERSLISSGSNDEPSTFEAVSRDGSAVLFVTSDALAPQDDEAGLPKLYAARTNGGFPFTRPLASCDGQECRSGSPSPPAYEAPGSARYVGPGNAVAASECGKLARQSKTAKRRVSKLGKKLRRANSLRRAKSKRVKSRLKTQRRKASRNATKLNRRLARCRAGEGK